MTRLFGTDGVRGIANRELTPELAFRLGYAGAKVLIGEVSHRPRMVVGKDTRLSCDMLEAALVAGMNAAGADALTVGVVPTPGVAWLTRAFEADAGVMISASHNSYEYNGIKFFAGTGFKLPDRTEDKIEAAMRDLDALTADRPAGDRLGRIVPTDEGAKLYRRHLQKIAGLDLSGLRLALDCANGAAYRIAPRLMRDLGAEVVSLGVDPDGTNINRDCGSTHLEHLQKLVVSEKADLGLAFDGDADRLLAVDDTGDICDGDVIMAILALDMKARGRLRGNTIVSTVMSNLGLEIMARRERLVLERTRVGDRYVLERMLESGFSLGGEQSGHLILLDDTTTGDGMLSALRLLGALRRSGKKLSEARSILRICPQVLKNARIPEERKNAIMNAEALRERIEAVGDKLGEEGRVLVRASGTEPVIRVMIEGVNRDDIAAYADELCDLIMRLV